jgi:hypothetical protein
MGPSQPIWFDPKLFAGTRRYVGAAWLAGAVPVLVVGVVVAGGLGGLVALGVWAVVCLAVASGLNRARAAWLRDTRAPTRCQACGAATFTDPCPDCGAPVDRYGDLRRDIDPAGGSPDRTRR